MRAFWSDEEMELLEQHVDDRNWFGKVRPQMGNRSEAALRKRMCDIRAEKGMGDCRLSGDWMREAATASRALLQAIRAAGLRP